MRAPKLAAAVLLTFFALAYVIAAPIIVLHINQQAIKRNRKALVTMCSVATQVIRTAYTPTGAAIDRKTLPAETQRVLAALDPFIAASSVDGGTEKKVLAKLDGIPGCVVAPALPSTPTTRGAP